MVQPPNKIERTAAILRSSRPEVFCKKGVLRNFTKFTGKHLCQSLFFFSFFLRTPFLTEHLCWLRLNFGHAILILELLQNFYVGSQVAKQIVT